jgi:hypothetical protein
MSLSDKLAVIIKKQNMTFEEIVHFLKNDIWGLIILGGLGSILGSLLIYFGRKLYLWLAQHYKVFRTKYFFRQLMQNYSEGYTAGLAINSTYSQALLVGRYIINCIKHFSLLIGKYLSGKYALSTFKINPLPIG